jgi:WD40 repeat protein
VTFAISCRLFGVQALLFVCASLSIQSCVSDGTDSNALGRIVAKLGHSEEIGEVAWHPDGSKIVVADNRSQSLALWDSSSKKKRWQINKYGIITANSIGFSGDGEISRKARYR